MLLADRDPDNLPVDPDADDDREETTAGRFRSLWRPVDPDAGRLARLAGDEDGLAVDPEDHPREPLRFA